MEKESGSIHLAKEEIVPDIKKENVAERYRWASKWDFISATMACTFSMEAFDMFSISSKSEETGFSQYTVFAIFFCLPLVYMQLLLGQYTQLGTILFKYLSPIGHGIGFVLICNLLLKTIKHSLFLNDSVFYFMSSFRTELQWMNCSSKYNIPCWDKSVDCQNCINSTYYMPGYIYFFFHYMKNPELDPDKMKLGVPPIRKTITHFVCWSFTCFTLMFTTNNYIRVIKIIWRICLVLLLILIIGCMMPDGRKTFVSLVLVGSHSVANFSSWTSALSDSVGLFGLGRAFHIVHGSFMANKAPTGLLSILVVVVHFLLTCGCSILTVTCIHKIAYYTKTNSTSLSEISWTRGPTTYLYVVPQGLGFMGIPQLWSCVYFGICILININQQITHLVTIEKSLSDVYPNLLRYRKYVLSIFSIFSSTIGCIFLSRESYLIYKAVCFRMSECSEMLNVVLICVLVCWIYGVQRFCDDMHFTTGRLTTRFWKICWYILPFVAIVAHVEITFFQYRRLDTKIRTMDLSLYFIFASPVPIVAIIQTFKFIRKRDVFGLFQPEERFGPPDPNDRLMRRLFNPRKETRSKRRAGQCHHPCLITSESTNAVVLQETTFRHEFTLKIDEDYESGDHED